MKNKFLGRIMNLTDTLKTDGEEIEYREVVDGIYSSPWSANWKYTLPEDELARQWDEYQKERDEKMKDTFSSDEKLVHEFMKNSDKLQSRCISYFYKFDMYQLYKKIFNSDVAYSAMPRAAMLQSTYLDLYSILFDRAGGSKKSPLCLICSSKPEFRDQRLSSEYSIQKAFNSLLKGHPIEDEMLVDLKGLTDLWNTTISNNREAIKGCRHYIAHPSTDESKDNKIENSIPDQVSDEEIADINIFIEKFLFFRDKYIRFTTHVKPLTRYGDNKLDVMRRHFLYMLNCEK